MSQLREEVLIKKGLFYWMLPNLIFGLLGSFFPLVSILIPVHEEAQCLCSFYNTFYPGPPYDSYFPVITNTTRYLKLRGFNLCVFIVLNWLFLALLANMVFRIRMIHDEAMIK